MRSFGITEDDLFCRMTYWQSSGYIRAVFPAMGHLAQFKMVSILSRAFPDKNRNEKPGSSYSVDEMVEMGLFGKG